MSKSPPSPGERDDGQFLRAPASGGTLHEAPDIHQLLVSSVQDYAIFVMDKDGHILTWNPGAERLKGYTADEIVGKHFSIFYPEVEVERGHPAYELTVAEAEGRYAEEGWRIRKDGSRFWASVTITAMREKDGTLVGFAKVTRDLTERKMAQERLRESEERFRLLVQSVQDYGIFMLDPDGRVASWNTGAERMKGYTEQEILGRHFATFYPDEDLIWGKPAMELRVATKVGRFEDEGWRIRKDGSRFWANVVITALWNSSGELVGFAKVTRDLTDRRATEMKALEDARKISAAEAANRAKGEFLATMSHELRTPLNAIGGYIDLLILGVHGPLEEEQHKALERVRASQRHLLALINDLLNFSRVEAGRITYNIEPVDLADVTTAVEAMVSPQALEKEISIEWQAPDTPVVAIADRARVEQILLNLATNAIKYTDAGGHVYVRYYLRGDCAVLEVSDNGVGISAEFLDTIFEPFTQVGRSLTSEHEGTGLGLAISRDLARAMNGDLTAESAVDEGSTFTVTLPRA